jgi:uncharacterized coiled-coil DUF342 family protein
MTHNTGNPARDAVLDQIDGLMATRDAKRAEVDVIRNERRAINAAIAPQVAQMKALKVDIKAKIASTGLPELEKELANLARTLPGNKVVTPDGTLALPE